MRHYTRFLILCCIIFTGCDSKSQKEMEFKHFKELHKHDGTVNYEVKTLFPKEFEILETSFNKETRQLIVPGQTNPVKKEDKKGERLKITHLGKIQDSGSEPGGILKDGTLKKYNTYYSWIVDGDKTKYSFKKPLSESEHKNADKWLKTFKELYDKASYVYEESWDYFFKIENEWFHIEYNLDVVNEDFVKNQYPPKIDFYIKKEKRDTSFMKSVGYEEFDSEEGEGINPINYSAGYHYIELYMPKGDTIKFKRFGSMGVNIETYKVPKEYGGRDDVIFIVQEPNELYPNNEFGGMYVIRPRELSENKK